MGNCICREGWGNADEMYSALFELIEHHCRGFLRNAAEYKKSRDNATKSTMLYHAEMYSSLCSEFNGYVRDEFGDTCDELKRLLNKG